MLVLLQNSKKMRSLLFLLCLVFGGCGTNFPGSIELIKIQEETPASTLFLNGANLYVVYENGSNSYLVTYDVSQPENPIKLHQTDAFKGPHSALFPALHDKFLLLGKDGNVAMFSMSNPQRPTLVWGKDKTIQLIDNVGPFALYSKTSAMYVSPGNGTALVRIDLTNLLRSNNLSEIETATRQSKKTWKGGGGGGINVVFDENQNPVRLYVGHKDKGQIDAWLLTDLENEKETKPTPIALPDLSKVHQLLSYKKNPDAATGWLIVRGDPEKTPNYQVLSLGNYWVDASRPKLEKAINVGEISHFDQRTQTFLSSSLDVWDASLLATPIQVAQLTLVETLDIRKIETKGNIVYSAEKAGFRLYRIKKKRESSKISQIIQTNHPSQRFFFKSSQCSQR